MVLCLVKPKVFGALRWALVVGLGGAPSGLGGVVWVPVGVVLPPSTLTVSVLRRFFESALTRCFAGSVIEL